MRLHAALGEEAKRLTSVRVLLVTENLYFHDSNEAKVEMTHTKRRRAAPVRDAEIYRYGSAHLLARVVASGSARANDLGSVLPTDAAA